MLYSLQNYPIDKRLLRLIGYPSQNESFWIAGISSIYHIEGLHEEFVSKNVIIPDSVWDVAMEPSGVLWLATAQGLARHSPVPWRIPIGIPRINQVCHSIIEDQNGRLWFACVDTLNCFESGQWKTYVLPRRLFESDTNSLCVLPDGRIAIRPTTDSLFVFNPEIESVEYIQRPASHHIELIAQRKNGGILLDSYGSAIARLESYDGERFETVLERETKWASGYSRYMIEAKDGTIWMAGEDKHGLARIQNGQYQLLGPEENYPGGDAFCILEKDDGKIWIGGRDSILEYRDNKYTVVRSGFGIVQSMIQSRNGDVWIASETGLHRFRNGSWVTHTEEDGLPTRMVNEVFEDSQSRIWIGTSQGIRQYDPKTDMDPPIAFLDPKNPEEISSKGDAQFFFSGIDKWKFTESHRLLYSYQIDEGNWTPYVSGTVASITGLTPGNHVLHYRVMDRNWNESEPVSCNFRVAQIWYKERKFLIIISISTVIILGLLGMHLYNYFQLENLVRVRTSSLSAANKELVTHQTQLQNLTSELSLIEERERRGLASDLHDSVSQSISLSIMELSDIGESNSMDDVREKAAGISDRLEQSLHATQNMTFELCPPELYQIGLDAAIRELAAQLRKQNGIDYVIKDDRHPTELSEDLRYFLFRATRELLINITKHASAKRVWIQLNSIDDTFTIQVRDDGIGFNPKTIQHDSMRQGGFGLFSLRERLTQLGGSLTIESKSGEGSEITITIPLTRVS